MQSERIEKLKEEYTDRYVVADASRPELARFKGMTGRVKTVNFNGRALVEFDADSNRGWYDIELDFLKVVEKPAPQPPPEAKPAPKKEPAKAPAASPEEKLSPLELARLEREADRPADKPNAK